MTQLTSAPMLKSLAAGQVLCREGDPPGPMYVICSGSVRAYRQSLKQRGAIEELARLGPGEIVGEMAAMLKQARSATLQALEPSEVLEVPTPHVRGMLKQHKSLLRVLAAALKDRAGLTHEEVEEIVARQSGLRMPRQPDTESDAEIPVPEHDPSIVYTKQVTCPACITDFFALVVHPQKDTPADRSSDFHQLYKTPYNPHDYEVWVCPNCRYASLPQDFSDISDLQRPRVAEVVAAVMSDWRGQQADFLTERNLALREKSLKLALALYRMRNASPLRLAAVLHRLAWCAREREDSDAERNWLSQALQAYGMAYNQFDSDASPKTELRVVYLCAELNARLGDPRAAVRWASEGLRHPAIKDHPHWERMLRQQWFDVRASA
jgi:uncharacterized protein